jgi:hypothetical protein
MFKLLRRQSKLCGKGTNSKAAATEATAGPSDSHRRQIPPDCQQHLLIAREDLVARIVADEAGDEFSPHSQLVAHGGARCAKWRCDIARNPGGWRKYRAIVGGFLVDDGQAGFDGRAMLGLDQASDRGGEHGAAVLCRRMKLSRHAGSSGEKAAPAVAPADRQEPSAQPRRRGARGRRPPVR